MSKYTPGQWVVLNSTNQTYIEVHTNRIVDHSTMTRQRVLSDIVAEVLPMSDDQTRRGNAQLIAAAPDLYNSLCECLYTLNSIMDYELYCVEKVRIKRTIEDAIKAVHKAEGKE